MSDHQHSPDHDCSLPASEAEGLLNRMIEELRKHGFRKTPALTELLGVMIRHHQPYTLSQLAEQPSLKDRDQATIYRLITKLKDSGHVRQLNLSGRVSHYQVILSGHHHDYLCCEECGIVKEVPIGCGLSKVEQAIMSEFGWAKLHHELEFFGLCPECAGEATEKPTPST